MWNFIPAEIHWLQVMPHIAVACTGIIVLIVRMIWGNKLSSGWYVCLTTFGLLEAIGWLYYLVYGGISGTTLGGMITTNRFNIFTNGLLILVTALVVLFSDRYLKHKKLNYPEFYSLITWATFGAMLMVSSVHMLVVFLGLEVLSISLYVLCGINPNDRCSKESGLKYLLMGGFASAIILYGMSFLYGATGFLNINDMELVLESMSSIPLVFDLGLFLVLIGLLFKCGFIPFHYWVPDVYQGAPTNVTAYMSTVTKIASLAVLYRMLDGFILLKDVWLMPLCIIAGVSMLFGSCLAVVQQDAKRALSYSSIVNAGYLLVAILSYVINIDNIDESTMLIYFVAYSAATISAFTVLGSLVEWNKENLPFARLFGMRYKSRLAVFTLLISMLSLIGLPPTAGFFGKLLIMCDAFDSCLTTLVIVLGISSIISAYYYLRIIRSAYAEPDYTISTNIDNKEVYESYSFKLVCYTCLIITLGLPLWFNLLINWTGV